MDIKPLLLLMCAKVASMLKGTTEELCGFVFVSDLIALEYQGKRRLKYDGHSTLERITHPKRRRKSGMSSRISLDRSTKILVTI